MSKQSEAKMRQGYTTEVKNCSNCANYSSDRKLPAWMVGNSTYEDNAHRYEVESNVRCGLGGFAIKKTASCEQYKDQS